MLYAIGDLHLSFEANKPMDVFGKRWVGYVEKLRRGLSVIGPEDTTVLLGDLSWSMDLEHAVADFGFISAIPGRKIILKGNHDYWWTTAAKFYRFCQEHDYKNMWVSVEHDGTSAAPVGLELCCELRRLCDRTGDRLYAVLIGPLPEAEIQKIADCGGLVNYAKTQA